MSIRKIVYEASRYVRVGMRCGLIPIDKFEKFRQYAVQREYATCPTGMKVTICGACGCTGQPLALLLKQCPLIDEIALFDIAAGCGYGMELSHVDTKCKVSSYSGNHMLCDSLRGANVVVIVARNKRDSFENNAPVITEIALQICNVCPSAVTIVATEPVESLVPLVSEIQRLRGIYDPHRLMGCVELHCVRANTVLADFLRVPPEVVRVPVVGGATPKTMVPLLSAATHPGAMTQEQVECVTSSIMNGNKVVAAAKVCGSETPCLAGAYAVARNTINTVKGLQGRKDVVQCVYCDSMGTCAPDCQFFASDVVLGPSGVEKNLGLPELTKFENCLLCNSLPYIRNEIARAIWLVYTMCQQGGAGSPYCPTPSCFTSNPPPCAPPVNWSCDFPDSCRDEYLASICRDMTGKCGSTDLSWKPRDRCPVTMDPASQAKVAGSQCRIETKSGSCTDLKKATECKIPRSIRIQQEIRSKWNKCN